MRSADRRALNEALDLPSGYRGEEYDDFVNCDRHKESLGSLRVIRIVGPHRCLVLFTYERGDTNCFHVHSNYRLMYLREDGQLSQFNAKMRMSEALEDARDKCNVSWDRVISYWLEDVATPKAMTFTGRGWAERCAKEINKLVGWWEDSYDPTLPKEGDR